MRVLRSLGLVALGVYAGFAAAAAVMKRVLPSRGDAESDEVALVAIFDGVELESRAQAFRGGSMLAWFGGVAVDLREAELAPGGATSRSARSSAGSRPGAGGVAGRVDRARVLCGGVSDDVPEPDDPAAPDARRSTSSAAFGGIAVGARAADAAIDELARATRHCASSSRLPERVVRRVASARRGNGARDGGARASAPRPALASVRGHGEEPASDHGRARGRRRAARKRRSRASSSSRRGSSRSARAPATSSSSGRSSPSASRRSGSSPPRPT